MPSCALSATRFAHSSSGTEGGHFGDPLTATNTRAPSGLTRTPRGRFPTGMVATTSRAEVSMTDRVPESSLET